MQNKSSLPPHHICKVGWPDPFKANSLRGNLTNKQRKPKNQHRILGAFFLLASASQKTLKWGLTGRTRADFDLKSLLHSLDPRPGKGEYPNKCENPDGFFFRITRYLETLFFLD